MADRPSFIVELFRRSPLGPSLGIVAFVALAFLWYSFEIDPSVPHGLRVIACVVAFLAMSIGMHLTHKAAFLLQCERRAADSARAAVRRGSLGNEHFVGLS